MTNENVLVIKDNYIKENFSSFLTNGSKNILYPFNSNKSKEDIETLITQYSTFMPRDKVENDENYRQLIPYVVIKNKEEKIFIVKRTNKTTEKRLHNNYSLGMGGHINDQDKGSNNFQIFKNGMYREISEEINFIGDFNPEIKGWIYSNQTPVDKVHMGLVYILNVENASIKEVENFEGGFKNIKEISKYYNKLESWSKIVYNWIKNE